ncbi:hypothetical protein GCM10023069_17990 [Shinella granuli]
MPTGMSRGAKHANPRQDFRLPGHQAELGLSQQGFCKKQGDRGIGRAVIFKIVAFRFMEEKFGLREAFGIRHMVEVQMRKNDGLDIAVSNSPRGQRAEKPGTVSGSAGIEERIAGCRPQENRRTPSKETPIRAAGKSG